ncbi:MAG: translation initiation factor IF-3 [Actinomycetes bacterium]
MGRRSSFRARRRQTQQHPIDITQTRTQGGRSISDQRINADIKVPRVRLIDADGEQVGIVQLAEALRRAREQDLDLVEVAPNADPPVCRIMDHGKHKYQQAQKEKEARKRQSQITIKEIKMRPKISDNDYGTKSGHVRRFLNDGAKVRATIMFRGREMTHTELGKRLLDRLADDMDELATIEAYPKVDGRNMVMVLAPRKRRVEEVPGDEATDPEAAPEPDLEPGLEAAAEPDPAQTT